MSNTSRTDWARVDAMSDDQIDTSDIPPLTDDFFANAKLRMPSSSLATVAIRVDPETLLWFSRKDRKPNNTWLLPYEFMQQRRKMLLMFVNQPNSSTRSI